MHNYSGLIYVIFVQTLTPVQPLYPNTYCSCNAVAAIVDNTSAIKHLPSSLCDSARHRRSNQHLRKASPSHRTLAKPVLKSFTLESNFSDNSSTSSAMTYVRMYVRSLQHAVSKLRIATWYYHHLHFVRNVLRGLRCIKDWISLIATL